MSFSYVKSNDYISYRPRYILLAVCLFNISIFHQSLTCLFSQVHGLRLHRLNLLFYLMKSFIDQTLYCSYALFDMDGKQVPQELVVEVGITFESILEEVWLLKDLFSHFS